MEEDGEEEQVMSEVHLGCPPRFPGPHVSRFTFSAPPPLTGDQLQEEAPLGKLLLDNDGDLVLTRRNGDSSYYQIGCSNQLHMEDSSSQLLTLDEDGDLVLDRQTYSDKTCLKYVLAIRHSVTSSLPSVGLQVWRAALLLADFVLHIGFTSSNFDGITALELGAGTGLVGIALARFARSIFLTDIGNKVLDNCAANVHINSSFHNSHGAFIHVRELNWKKSWPPEVAACDFAPEKRMPDPTECSSRLRYSWNSSEIEEAEGASLLLAADVIYNEALTDSLFSILEKLMSRGCEKVLYLALEKRYNFTLEDLEVVANGYAHFQSFLKDEESARLDDKLRPCFMGMQIDQAQIPQYIREYERGKDLELWKITYVR